LVDRTHKIAPLVQHAGSAAWQAACEISTRGAQNNHPVPSHMRAAVVVHALIFRDAAEVADAEVLASPR